MSSVTPTTSKGYAMRDASRNPSGPFGVSRSPARPAPWESIESEPLGEAAFTDLLNRYQWPLYAFLRGFVRNDEHARDLTQDVFCDAWRAALRAAPPFVTAQTQTRPDDDAIRRWLFHTAYQRAVSALRRRNLIQWESLDAQAEGVVGAQSGASPGPPEHGGQHGSSSTAFNEPFTESFEDQVIEGQALGAALATLAPEDVATLLLSVVHGFTTAEIAQVIDATPSAAKKRLSRAKQRLRERYLAQNADTHISVIGNTPVALQSSSPTAREEPRS